MGLHTYTPYRVGTILTSFSTRSAVADMKREHELDLQRVKELHRQGVEALKATHSHTQWVDHIASMHVHVDMCVHHSDGYQS